MIDIYPLPWATITSPRLLRKRAWLISSLNLIYLTKSLRAFHILTYPSLLAVSINPWSQWTSTFSISSSCSFIFSLNNDYLGFLHNHSEKFLCEYVFIWAFGGVFIPLHQLQVAWAEPKNHWGYVWQHANWMKLSLNRVGTVYLHSASLKTPYLKGSQIMVVLH